MVTRSTGSVGLPGSRSVVSATRRFPQSSMREETIKPTSDTRPPGLRAPDPIATWPAWPSTQPRSYGSLPSWKRKTFVADCASATTVSLIRTTFRFPCSIKAPPRGCLMRIR